MHGDGNQILVIGEAKRDALLALRQEALQLMEKEGKAMEGSLRPIARLTQTSGAARGRVNDTPHVIARVVLWVIQG